MVRSGGETGRQVRDAVVPRCFVEVPLYWLMVRLRFFRSCLNRFSPSPLSLTSEWPYRFLRSLLTSTMPRSSRSRILQRWVVRLFHLMQVRQRDESLGRKQMGIQVLVPHCFLPRRKNRTR